MGQLTVLYKCYQKRFYSLVYFTLDKLSIVLNKQMCIHAMTANLSILKPPSTTTFLLRTAIILDFEVVVVKFWFLYIFSLQNSTQLHFSSNQWRSCKNHA